MSINGTKLFVSDTSNNRIQIFDLFGNHLLNLGSGVAGNGTNQFSSPREVIANGTRIFVSDTGNNRIQIFNSSGAFQKILGSGISGNGTDQFSLPSGIATNGTHIFVSDTGNNRIQVFNSTLNLVTSISLITGCKFKETGKSPCLFLFLTNFRHMPYGVEEEVVVFKEKFFIKATVKSTNPKVTTIVAPVGKSSS